MSRAEAEALLPGVSRETWDRLELLRALLEKWQRTINLVSPASLPHFWMRHAADSLQLLALAPEGRHWVDLGSGAGFPGLVVAAALPPEGQMHLVESDERKCSFLREAARRMGVAASVHPGRIKSVLGNWSRPADVVTARALAPLDRLIELAYPLLTKGAVGLFLKGQDVEVEIEKATTSWDIDAELIPSITDPRARVIVVSRAEPR